MTARSQSWPKVRLGEVASFEMGQAPAGKDCNTEGRGAVFVKAGEFGKIRPEVREWTTDPKKYASEDDVLICVVGATSGKLNLGMNCAIGRSVAAIKPSASILQKIIYFQLLLQVETLRSASTGSAQGVISKEMLANIELVLPPLSEQERIVEKIDSLMARVGVARESLDRIPALLKRFRQSVLAAATSGELTRKWRGGDDAVWDEKPIGEVGKVQLGRQRAPKYHSGAAMRPYLRVQNVFEDRIDLSDVMEMDFPGEDAKRYELHSGDILLNEGQSPQFLGRPAIYRGELPGACFTNSLIRFQANRSLAFPEFALIVFRHHMHSGRYADEGSITTNIAHLSAGRFSKIEFPLPSLDEQAEIVRRVGVLLSLSSGVVARLDSARRISENVSAAILGAAFS